MQKIKWKVFYGAALLLSGCATLVPDIEGCSGVTGFPGVSALCRQTNSDSKRRLTPDEWIDFLYAREAITDPNDPSKTLEAKGPAVCMSSKDYQRNDAALVELCAKGNCTYEQKKALERLRALHNEVQNNMF